MKRRLSKSFLYPVVVFLALASSCALAADSAGSISVEIERLDQGFPFLFLLCVALVAAGSLVASFILIMRSRSSQQDGEGAVELKGEAGGFRPDGYYDRVFNAPVRARPAEVVPDDPSRRDGFIALDELEAPLEFGQHLKEDEVIVINVLRMKGGSCSQSTLRIATDFSKARLSRILSELEERSVVYKEQRGRKNIITLKA